MLKTRTNKTYLMILKKKGHLLTSSVLVLIIGLCYGISPHTILPLIFDFKVETIDLHNILRAMMGFCFGNVFIWMMGVLNAKYWQMATFVNIVFMSSLALGRLLSLFVDGFPSPILLMGLIAEIVAAFWGIMNLKSVRHD